MSLSKQSNDTIIPVVKIIDIFSGHKNTTSVIIHVSIFVPTLAGTYFVPTPKTDFPVLGVGTKLLPVL